MTGGYGAQGEGQRLEKSEFCMNDVSHPLDERIRVKLNSGLMGPSWVRDFPGEDNGERRKRESNVL